MKRESYKTLCYEIIEYKLDSVLDGWDPSQMPDIKTEERFRSLQFQFEFCKKLLKNTDEYNESKKLLNNSKKAFIRYLKTIKEYQDALKNM